MIARQAQLKFNQISRRYFNLQEYQSKELMNKFGLSTQKFKIISNVSEAERAFNDLSNCKLHFINSF